MSSFLLLIVDKVLEVQEWVPAKFLTQEVRKFSVMSWTGCSYSAESPRLLGKGTWLARKLPTLYGDLVNRGDLPTEPLMGICPVGANLGVWGGLIPTCWEGEEPWGLERSQGCTGPRARERIGREQREGEAPRHQGAFKV